MPLSLGKPNIITIVTMSRAMMILLANYIVQYFFSVAVHSNSALDRHIRQVSRLRTISYTNLVGLGFEPAIPEIERLQTYALDRTPTGHIRAYKMYHFIYRSYFRCNSRTQCESSHKSVNTRLFWLSIYQRVEPLQSCIIYERHRLMVLLTCVFLLLAFPLCPSYNPYNAPVFINYRTMRESVSVTDTRTRAEFQ